MIDDLELQAIELQREIDASRAQLRAGADARPALHRATGETRWRHAAAHIGAAWAALTSHPEHAGESAGARTS